ncbi:MAG: extracellular solute-binding protein [Treponema sp.]|nr:extracellular solute-binding protein [Treponema sp.]
MRLLTRWPTAKIRNTIKKMNRTTAIITTAAALFASFSLVSCSESDSTVIIWTDRQELASYAELFNASHKNVKAVAIYKESPIASLPPEKKDIQPDLIIGSWLKSSKTRKYFSPLDYLFEEDKLNENDFYPQMVEYGILNDRHYLVPLSFNLPMMVFSQQNEALVENEHTLNLNTLMSASSEFNSKKDTTYTAIGYAPSWDSDFLYEASKIFGANYQEKGLAFSWNNDALNATVNFMRKWTTDFNQSTSTETDFQFKHLFMPKYKQVSSGRAAFTFMTSNEFFTLSNEQAMGLTFRWLVNNDGKAMVEDSLVTMGIFHNAHNKKGAEIFIQWISTEEAQAEILNLKNKVNLDTVTFGIAGGFSALKPVNTTVFPAQYRELLGNLPGEQSLEVPLILPYRWPTLKEKVLETYLLSTTDTALALDSEDYPKMENLVEDSKRFAY